MPALAMGLGWAGYTLGLWGYCLVRGYDVTLLELVDFRHVPTWASITASKAPPSSIFPSSGGLDTKPATSTPNPLTKGTIISGALKLRDAAAAALKAGGNKKAA